MWKFIGDGSSYLPGVPARDLTDAEFAAFQACEAPSQVWLDGPDGAYPLNVVPVAGVKVLADGTEHRFGLETCGLYEFVADSARRRPAAGGDGDGAAGGAE